MTTNYLIKHKQYWRDPSNVWNCFNFNKSEDENWPKYWRQELKQHARSNKVQTICDKKNIDFVIWTYILISIQIVFDYYLTTQANYEAIMLHY